MPWQCIGRISTLSGRECPMASQEACPYSKPTRWRYSVAAQIGPLASRQCSCDMRRLSALCSADMYVQAAVRNSANRRGPVSGVRIAGPAGRARARAGSSLIPKGEHCRTNQPLSSARQAALSVLNPTGLYVCWPQLQGIIRRVCHGREARNREKTTRFRPWDYL
jgi:hypothetical protein